MRFNEAGLKLIKEFEGCALSAYRDQAGVLSIGYGKTRGVTEGMSISEPQANEFLLQDLLETQNRVLQLVHVDLTENQYSAIVCLVFNIGCAHFRKSSLLDHLEAGDMAAAADAFLLWDKITVDGVKQDSPGLLRRRQAERALFLSA